jgi:phosphoglycerate dehydrogenase-like enzyme
MRPDAYLITTAAAVADEDALADALAAGQIAGAGMSGTSSPTLTTSC